MLVITQKSQEVIAKTQAKAGDCDRCGDYHIIFDVEGFELCGSCAKKEDEI